MTFGQSWVDAGQGFPAEPSLDLNFSFDPSLIEALPDSIPDFFLVTPRQAVTLPEPQQSLQQNHLESEPLTPNEATTTQQQSAFNPSSTQSLSRASTPSDTSSRTGARRRSTKRDKVEDKDAVLKRQRNTIAARKYRQKRLDRIKDLEDALDDMTKERDDLRLKLARQEAETAALKDIMRMNNGQNNVSK